MQATATSDGLRAYAQTNVDAEPLALSPNPATSTITATYPLPAGNYNLCIYNATTMQLSHGQAINGTEGTLLLNISNLNAGMHVVNIVDTTGAVIRTGKFIKQ